MYPDYFFRVTMVFQISMVWLQCIKPKKKSKKIKEALALNQKTKYNKRPLSNKNEMNALSTR